VQQLDQTGLIEARSHRTLILIPRLDFHVRTRYQIGFQISSGADVNDWQKSGTTRPDGPPDAILLAQSVVPVEGSAPTRPARELNRSSRSNTQISNNVYQALPSTLICGVEFTFTTELPPAFATATMQLRPEYSFKPSIVVSGAMQPDDLLRTQQVADAFHVSVSTIKRWVDSGALVATRTLGRHRLIARSEAYRFARERNLLGADWEILAGSGVKRRDRIDARLLDELTVALRRGRAAEARRLVLSAHAHSGGTILLADSLLRPAMERLGQAWADRSLDIFQEHRATRILESTLLELITRTPAARSDGSAAPLAVGASPDGDLYTLSGLLCELVLREQGWEVMNLGPNLPLSSLATAVRAHRPRLTWISVNHVADPAAFVKDYAVFFATAKAIGTATVLGGHALSAELRRRVVAASFADCIAHLEEFAKRLGTITPMDEADPISGDSSTGAEPG
jgi:excisionase family DNA binding protein